MPPGAIPPSGSGVDQSVSQPTVQVQPVASGLPANTSQGFSFVPPGAIAPSGSGVDQSASQHMVQVQPVSSGLPANTSQGFRFVNPVPVASSGAPSDHSATPAANVSVPPASSSTYTAQPSLPTVTTVASVTNTPTTFVTVPLPGPGYFSATTTMSSSMKPITLTRSEEKLIGKTTERRHLGIRNVNSPYRVTSEGYVI